jgi:hypothetical protein
LEHLVEKIALMLVLTQFVHFLRKIKDLMLYNIITIGIDIFHVSVVSKQL